MATELRLCEPMIDTRHCRVLWVDARVLVKLFANMSLLGRSFRAVGMPADARLVAEVFESYMDGRNEQRIGLLIESATFDSIAEGQLFPELTVTVTEAPHPTETSK